MRFNTHDRTLRTKTTKSLRIMLAICYGLFAAFLLFMAIACSLVVRNIIPAVLIVGPFFVPAIVILITQKDMDRAYVEISDPLITVVEYCFGVERKKVFSMQDIATAEILIGSSMAVRGYRYSNAGCSYIVFRDHNGKYMFKIICVPETKQFFGNFLKQ